MKRYSIIFISLILLFCFGCINIRKQTIEDDTPPEEDTKVSVLEEGRKLLALPTEDLFFSALPDYMSVNKEDAEQLLKEYKQKQEKLFIHSLENENYADTWFYYNNLLAFDTPDKQDKDGFYNVLIKGFEKKGYEGTSRYLTLLLGKPLEEKKSPYPGITSYEDILVEIYVTMIYEDKYTIRRKKYSFGSGFLLNNTQIITAFHIIESCFAVNTEKYDITIKQGDTLIESVTIAGWDSLTDIALLEIKSDEFEKTIDFISILGNSDTLHQGDDIYCLGHHNGLTSTLTKGIISATKRSAPEAGTWIQIDANVAPGASGGLAIGADRKIYGMVAAGIMYEDLNFIIPSNLILSVIDRLRHREQVPRPWIGLLLEEFPDKKGDISISDIFPTSPLHLYDLAPDDKLIEINGVQVKSIKHAQEIIEPLFAGNLVHLKIKNYKRTKECWILLGRRPDYPIYNATLHNNKLSSLFPHFGFGVNDSEMLQENFLIDGKKLQLTLYRVVKIRRFSPLDSEGVQIGDYIGFLSDFFIDKTRYIEVLHFPKNDTLQEMEDINIYDFIYRLKKGAYDENIL